MSSVRVRFAPSPTGPFHIGGARSALFNYLLAKNTGGVFVIRIEDTDLERSSRESEENILESMKWLGITWDEGPDVGGQYAPYRQTERIDIYKKYIEKLLNKGDAYYCYCSEEEIEAQRQAFIEKGELPRYSGKCREVSQEQAEKFKEEGRNPVIRFKVPENKEIVVDDQVRGRVVFDSNGIGDFVIVKSDGIPTYNFAVVIDDSSMEITHVIRAEEHLSNTPRQVLVYEALGLTTPKFGHISLILGKDRSKMSKRHGATSVMQYKELGYLPEAVVNFLALLGWSPVGEEEIFSMEELIQQFSLDRVAKNPAVFDMEKLRWINGMYIRKSSVEKIVEMAIPYLQQSGYLSRDEKEIDRIKVNWIVEAVREKIGYISEIMEFMPLFTDQPVEFETEDAKKVLEEEEIPQVMALFKEKLNSLDEVEPEAIKKILKEITKELKLSGKKVYMPIRIALTGQQHGPELFYIIPVLGKEIALKKVASALQQVGIAI